MLELQCYAKAEMTAMFGTESMQGLKRKLERYGVTFETRGRGNAAIFDIQAISDPFKIFCILELGFDNRTDFIKVRNFYYYFFNDDEFMAMPDEVKEHRMTANGKHVSRQTIAGYTAKLERKQFIYRDKNTNKYIYYFAYKDTQRIVDRTEYLNAWHDYWKNIDEGNYSIVAIEKMREKYGGVARKQLIPEINGIYNDKIEYMCSLIQQSLEKEMQDEI